MLFSNNIMANVRMPTDIGCGDEYLSQTIQLIYYIKTERILKI